MEYPNNTPHHPGFWFMPSICSATSTYLFFSNEAKYVWLSNYDYEGCMKSHYLMKRLDMTNWARSIKSNGDDYFDKRANLLLPEEFLAKGGD